MARKWLPDNVTEYRDRHGKPRYRFRKTGFPVHHFKAEIGTPEFLDELRAAQTAVVVREERFAPFTYDALAVSLYSTPKWQAGKDSTQRTYRGIIDGWRKRNGEKDVRKITAANLEKKFGTLSATPAKANNLRKALMRLHNHAILLGWRVDNPVRPTSTYKAGKGHHCWTDEELAAFDKRWPIGTRERLAKELLHNTALRKSDVLTVGPRNRVGDRLNVHHSKNDSDTSVPIDSVLALALGPIASDPYIITEFGKPFTPGGFYNWFKRACVKADIPHCSPHGIRKAISRQLAESGATSLQGRAVTGHKTDREFAKYAESANRADMADAALANLRKPALANRAPNKENDK